MSYTLATRNNMRLFALRHSARTITLSDGNTATIEGKRCFAVSLNDPNERCSADEGDYWQLNNWDQPLKDSYGDPMVLAVEKTLLIDALTEEVL